MGLISPTYLRSLPYRQCEWHFERVEIVNILIINSVPNRYFIILASFSKRISACFSSCYERKESAGLWCCLYINHLCRLMFSEYSFIYHSLVWNHFIVSLYHGFSFSSPSFATFYFILLHSNWNCIWFICFLNTHVSVIHPVIFNNFFCEFSKFWVFIMWLI